MVRQDLRSLGGAIAECSSSVARILLQPELKSMAPCVYVRPMEARLVQTIEYRNAAAKVND